MRPFLTVRPYLLRDRLVPRGAVTYALGMVVPDPFIVLFNPGLSFACGFAIDLTAATQLAV